MQVTANGADEEARGGQEVFCFNVFRQVILRDSVRKLSPHFLRNNSVDSLDGLGTGAGHVLESWGAAPRPHIPYDLGPGVNRRL